MLLASIISGFGTWAGHAFLVRQGKARYWPFVATAVLAVSMNGPGYFADGGSAMALMALHFAVAIPLIIGFTAEECRDGNRTVRATEYRR